MAVRRGAILICLIGAMGFGAATAQADDGCTLKRLASLNVTGLERQRVVIPVGIGGNPYSFIVDTGSPYSVISRDLVRSQGLPIESIREGQLYNLSGKPFTDAVKVPKIEIGGMKGGPFWFVAGFAPRPDTAPFLSGTTGDSGLLGADLLMEWDIELNLAANKLNLFLPDHCPGRVVYWSNDYTVVPMTVDNSHHIVLPMKLDGEDIEGVLDTGAGNSTLSLSAARHLFDVDADSPGVQKVGDAYLGNTTPIPVYRKQFHTLEIGDITFKNPKIDLMEMRAPTPDKVELSMPDFGTNLPRFLLGIHELRMLRIYISYREHTLYMTAAEPAGVPRLN